MIAALQVLAVLAGERKPASEATRLYEPMPQVFENIRFRKAVRAGDRLSARYTVLVAEPSAKRPTLGKVLGRTEVVDEAGDVVYSADGWTLTGRRPSAGSGESTLS